MHIHTSYVHTSLVHVLTYARTQTTCMERGVHIHTNYVHVMTYARAHKTTRMYRCMHVGTNQNVGRLTHFPKLAAVFAGQIRSARDYSARKLVYIQCILTVCIVQKCLRENWCIYSADYQYVQRRNIQEKFREIHAQCMCIYTQRIYVRVIQLIFQQRDQGKEN